MHVTKFVNNATKFGHGARILSDCVIMKVDICIAFSFNTCFEEFSKL